MGLITRETALEQALAELNPTGRDWGQEQRARENASKAKDGRDAANAAVAVEKMGRRSRERIEQLENARGWAEYHGGRALMFHDLAARACEQRDQAIALVEQLETGR